VAQDKLVRLDGDIDDRFLWMCHCWKRSSMCSCTLDTPFL